MMRQEWFLIASAPKTGQHILGKHWYGKHSVSNQLVPPYVMHWFEGEWVLSNGDMTTKLFPTHWIPLPDFYSVESVE